MMENIYISPILFMPTICLSFSEDGLSNTLGKMFSLSEITVDTFITPSWWHLRHVNSPGISHLFSHLISDGEHLSSNMSHLFFFLPFGIFYLSVYCWVRGWSHNLGKAFSKAELSVNVHHPLAHDFTGHVNSPPGISHLISQLALLWW